MVRKFPPFRSERKKRSTSEGTPQFPNGISGKLPYQKAKDKFIDYIKDVDNQEKILVILDGLDELPEKSKDHVDKLLNRRILPFFY